jgi:hypothetical protein
VANVIFPVYVPAASVLGAFIVAVITCGVVQKLPHEGSNRGDKTSSRARISGLQHCHGANRSATVDSFRGGHQILNLEHYLDVLERKPGAMAGSTPLKQWKQAGRWPECLDRIWKKLEERYEDSTLHATWSRGALHAFGEKQIARLTSRDPCCTTGSTSPEEKRETEEKCYADFLRQGATPGPDFLHSLHAFLSSRASEVLDPRTTKELEEAERERDDERFMRILITHKDLFDVSTGNFLFHRWIRLLTIKQYPPPQQAVVESIPIAFIPFYPFLDAFITRTPRGNVICFTEALNSVLLGVFFTIAKSTRFQHYKPRYPQLSVRAAEDRIISFAKFLVEGCQETAVPPRLDVDEHVTDLADIFNNITQRFILAHEYNHFLLGHLKQLHSGAGIITSGNFGYFDSYDTDLARELAADELAVERLRRSNASIEGIQFNAFLCSGIYVFFLFNIICRKLLGYKADSSSDAFRRVNKATELIFHDADRVYLLEEIGIVDGALEKI